MAKYTARTRIKHDDKTYEPGEEISVSGEAAQRLVESGAVVVPDEKPSAKDDGKADKK